MDLSLLRKTNLTIGASYEICIRLTLALMLLYGSEHWFARAVTWSVAIPMMVVPPLARVPSLWLVMFTMLLGDTFYHWSTADNHKYLMSYWCLTVALSLWLNKRDRIATLSENGRILTGLAMTFAVVWKLSSWDYVSGDFFLFTFLTDKRFSGFIAFLSDMTPGQLLENHSRYSMLAGGYVDNILVDTHTVFVSDQVRWLAFASTWWTIAIESVLGFLFLWRIPDKHLWTRHVALLLFAATTYAIAPVAGFGCLLMVMGASQCQSKTKWLFPAYVAFFVIVAILPIAVDPLWTALTQ